MSSTLIQMHNVVKITTQVRVFDFFKVMEYNFTDAQGLTITVEAFFTEGTLEISGLLPADFTNMEGKP